MSGYPEMPTARTKARSLPNIPQEDIDGGKDTGQEAGEERCRLN
jgi:hypothetical protein